MENNWNYCYNDEHEYAEYTNAVGERVCFTCDPLSENNYHRPAAKIELGRLLKVHPSFFEVNPIWWIDEDCNAVSFKNAVFGKTYFCPFCSEKIGWYYSGSISKWRCDC